MSAEFETIATVRRAPQQSEQIAGYLAEAEQTRRAHQPGPPVTASPVRRCARCGRRDGWAGLVRWACEACMVQRSD